MSKVKNLPREIRFYATDEMHEWVKSFASERGDSISAIIRDCISQAMERYDRGVLIRKTDPLIELMHPLVEEMAGRMRAMSEKMGVELPGKGAENASCLEGENSAEKEG